MGKDRAPAKAPAAPASAAVEERKPIARGHRQRGAGTVITAKAAVITADGITLKPHERLPFQLLHEFCQKEKRPIPKYQQVGGKGHRLRVVLEDVRNSKNDLTFCPVQAFESDSVAKDYAALLALFHFQHNLPLERKLPHPFASSWQQLVSGTSTAVTLATEDTAQVYPGTGASDPVPSTITVNAATADWICETCGQVNTAITLQGNARRKCFKCQALKTDGCMVVASTKSSNKISDTAAVSKPAGTTMIGVKTVEIKAKKPPSVVLNLRAQDTHASAGMAQQLELAERKEKNSRMSYADALRKANAYPPLTLPDRVMQRFGIVSAEPADLPLEMSWLLAPYGWDAGSICRAADTLQMAINILPKDMDDVLKVLALHGILLASAVDRRGEDILSPPFDDEQDIADDDQVEALEAIYGDAFSVAQFSIGRVWALACPCKPAGMTVEMKFLSSSTRAALLQALPWSPAPFAICCTPADPVYIQNLHEAIGQRLRERGTASVSELCVAFAECTEIAEQGCGRRWRVSNERLRSICGWAQHECEEESQPDDAVGSMKLSKSSSKSRGAHQFWRPFRGPPQVGRVNEDMVQALPAFQKRTALLDAMETHQCVVITGETGCGKTTQIPQFIVEARPCAKVIVCQPRRLAATAVATRIAQEMGVEIGGKVGYMVKGDVRAGSSTQVLFLTYGVLLRRLQDDPTLAAVDCVVLDEVHERGVDSDFSLALLLQALRARPKLQLLLMSATISTDHFLNYLHCHLRPPVDYPVLSIAGRTFPVKALFKDEFEGVVRCFPLPEPRGNVVLPRRARDVDYELLLCTVLALVSRWNGKEALGQPMRLNNSTSVCIDKEHIERCNFVEGVSGAILIFLPGVQEIDRMLSLLRAFFVQNAHVQSLVLLPLHSNLTPQEQQQVFRCAPAGAVKVICSTNIAEASVTIPDVTVVLDSAKVKQMQFDTETQTQRLVTTLASRQALTQRAGRAGRVSEGRVYACVTSYTHANILAPYTPPEILRMALDSVVLMAWGMKSVYTKMNRTSDAFSALDVLRFCVDCPPAADIIICEQKLAAIRALDAENNCITSLGQLLLNLSCSPQFGRLLAMGLSLHCVADCAILAAALTCRSPFIQINYSTAPAVNKPEGTEEENIRNRARVEATMSEYSSACAGGIRKRATAMKSDLEVLVRVFAAFADSDKQRKFCQEKGLNFERMCEIRDTATDLLTDLADAGMLELPRRDVISAARAHERNSYGLSATRPEATVTEDARLAIFHSVSVSGLYPNIAFVLRPPKKFVEVMGAAIEKDVHARDIRLFMPTFSGGAQKAEEAVDRHQRDLATVFGMSGDTDHASMQKVAVHASSLNASNHTFPTCNYMVFADKFCSAGGQIFLQNTAEVVPWALVLFSGKLHYRPATGVLSVDNYIRFTCGEEVFRALQRLQSGLDTLLGWAADNQVEDEEMAHAVRELLSTPCEMV